MVDAPTLREHIGPHRASYSQQSGDNYSHHCELISTNGFGYLSNQAAYNFYGVNLSIYGIEHRHLFNMHRDTISYSMNIMRQCRP